MVSGGNGVPKFEAWKVIFDVGAEPKIGGFYPPKWMVKILETPIKMDDLGVPLFWKHPCISMLQKWPIEDGFGRRPAGGVTTRGLHPSRLG